MLPSYKEECYANLADKLSWDLHFYLSHIVLHIDPANSICWSGKSGGKIRGNFTMALSFCNTYLERRADIRGEII